MIRIENVTILKVMTFLAGKKSGIYETADSFCGSCARMIAPNIRTQPKISRLLKCCPRIIHPASTEIQESRLRIREATVGFMFFWPTICRGVSYTA